MHGIVFKTCRLPKDKFKYWLGHDGYVFVDHGFFKLRNFYTPEPIGATLLFHQILYFYGIYLLISYQLWHSMMIQSFFIFWTLLSTTGGAHRLFAHRSYVASPILKIFYIIGFSISAQGTMSTWAGGHRIHHKYSDTDADPHNCKRGFLFSHLGWMFTPEHPDVQAKHKMFDFEDLKSDPILRFQTRYYFYLMFAMSLVAPLVSDIYLTGNSFFVSFPVVISMRMINTAHIISFINSAAHMFGDRPYAPKIEARENPLSLSFVSLGEGYHNYHHAYPWDYRTAELGGKFNSTVWFIDACALLGLVDKRKTAAQKSIDRLKYKTAVYHGLKTSDLVPDSLLTDNNQNVNKDK